MNTTETTLIHPFEKAGLGLAPFTLIGTSTTEDRAQLNSERAGNGQMFTTNHCGGTCAYCGTAIENVFKIRSSDGNEFKVGCECVKKTGDHNLVKVVNKVVRDGAKERKAVRDQVIIDAARAKLPMAGQKLAYQPHPNAYFALQGKTMLDYVNWLITAWPTTSKLKAAFIINSIK